MRIALLVSTLAFFAVSATKDNVVIPGIGSFINAPGAVNYDEPSYIDEAKLAHGAGANYILRILAVYKQLVAGYNYWIVYHSKGPKGDQLCVIFFNYQEWDKKHPFKDTKEECSPFLVIPSLPAKTSG